MHRLIQAGRERQSSQTAQTPQKQPEPEHP